MAVSKPPCTETRPRLSAALLGYFAHGLSVHVGGCDASGAPQLCRATALRIDDDHRLSLLMALPAAEGLLRALQDRPKVAVVCCQPTTHHAVQIKGTDVVVLPAQAQDWDLRSDFKLRFLAEIRPYGFGEDFASAWLDTPIERCRVVSFTPMAAWNQTPGPGAGQAIPLFESEAPDDH